MNFNKLIPNGPNPRYATVRIQDNNGSTVGWGYFFQPDPQNPYTMVRVDVGGLNTDSGPHGLHIHEWGDLTDGCTTLGGHWDGEGKYARDNDHGSWRSNNHHLGDMRNNIEIDSRGNGQLIYVDPDLRLSGPYSIIGRSLVLHNKRDDMGMGSCPDSLENGCAGDRIGCGVIGKRDPKQGFPSNLFGNTPGSAFRTDTESDPLSTNTIIQRLHSRQLENRATESHLFGALDSNRQHQQQQQQQQLYPQSTFWNYSTYDGNDVATTPPPYFQSETAESYDPLALFRPQQWS